MPEVIQGKSLLLFFRKYSERKTADAAKLRFQTEHSLSFEKESSSTKTKDGNINTISPGESSADITSLAYKEDEGTTAIWKELRKWFLAEELVEVWQVDLSSKNAENKYDVDYFQGYFTNFKISASADDKVELSLTYAINGSGAQGQDTLTAAQASAVAAALYEYKKLAGSNDN